MHTKNVITTILLYSMAFFTPLIAEESDTLTILTLDKVMTLAEQNNRTVLQSLADIESAKASNTKAEWKTY